VIGIANVVREMEMFGQTTFISFARDNLVALRAAYPDADVQWLLGSISDDKLELLISSGMDADVAGSALTKEFIDAMHAAGRVVNAWTIDSLETAAHLRDIGVDMITTNILE
jgi:glycerophosphoryl diester phosphodiesterase